MASSYRIGGIRLQPVWNALRTDSPEDPLQELVVESAERQRVADCGVGRAGSPSRPVARFSRGGSEIRPYHVPTESYAPSRVPCTSRRPLTALNPNLLDLEQVALTVESAGISAQSAVPADDAVTGDDDAERILSRGRSGGTRRARRAGAFG